MKRKPDTATKATPIPRALRPRLWRAVVRLPGNPRTGTTFGPGYLSAREAHQWLLDRTAKILGPTGQRKRGQTGLPAKWRQKRSHITLSAETPLLDRGRETRQAIQKTLRTALIAQLAQETANDPAKPGDTLSTHLQAVMPGILEPLVELAGAEQDFERMTATDARAIAACTLLGAGQRMRAILDKRQPPARWAIPAADGTGWHPRTLAAIIDWRNSRGAWPRETDTIGAWHETRRLRALAAGDRA